MSNALVGLLTLRLPSLGWVFLASSLRLRFPFYLGPLSPVYLLVATQGLAAYSCFTTQSFWYSLKDLLAQLSASISSLVVSLYSSLWVLLFHPFTFCVGELGFSLLWVLGLGFECWRTGFFSSLSFGTRFSVLAVSGFFRTYLMFNFLARFHFSVSYSASVKGTVANSMLFAPVPCNAGINKNSASHFCPVRVRILWLLGAVNFLSLPFTYRTLRGRASLSPPSLPCPFHFQLTQARFHSTSVKGIVTNSICYWHINYKIHIFYGFI